MEASAAAPLALPSVSAVPLPTSHRRPSRLARSVAARERGIEEAGIRKRVRACRAKSI